MEWIQYNNEWTCEKFKIICNHRYFKLYYEKIYINSFNTLQLAKDEAENYKI